jgi:ferredoxin
MSPLFEVDESKCVKCGACVRDCAFRALKSADDGTPKMAYSDKCMRCQHCLAICPVGAVTFDGRKPEDSVLVKDLSLPTLDEVENWMRARRSVRRFAAEDVDRATLDRILASLGNAPTGCNARSLTFTCFPTRVATDRFRAGFISAIEQHRDGTRLLPRWLAIPAIKLRKGGEDMFFRGASGLLIVSSDETSPGVTTPREDVTIACAHFEMLANAAGIATCWCGFLNLVQKEVPEILEATVGIRRTTPFYAMLFGRPAVRYARCVQRDSYARIDYRD